MRVTAIAILVAIGASGCFEHTTPTTAPPPVASPVGIMAFQSIGDTAQGVPLPASFGGDIRVLSVSTAHAGPEPSLGVTKNGWIFAAAGASVLRSQDGGRTWPVNHSVPGTDRDPMLWVDPVTDRVFATHMNPAATCSTIAVSDDQGNSWSDPTLVCPALPGQIDHQKLATGPYAGPLATAEAKGVYPQLVTMCFSQPRVTHCAASHDGGKTFAQDRNVAGAPSTPAGPVPLASQLFGDCGGLNGRQRHAPDGTIYVPYGHTCERTVVAVSTDGGITWVERNANHKQLEMDPAVAVDKAGMAYYVYRSDDQRVHLLRSSDRFATVEGPFIVSPPAIKGTVFTSIVAGSKGRIAVAYLGNNASSAAPDDVPRTTAWNLYLSMSLDADDPEPTFATVQVNPDPDPIQRGSVCSINDCKHDDRNLLEFQDLEMGPDGRPWLAYADGCTPGPCTAPGQTNPNTSHDGALTVAWVNEGPSLLEEKGRLGST
ncbi:MAG: sialidase family protein [bacterium]